jgi:hypothetical protein
MVSSSRHYWCLSITMCGDLDTVVCNVCPVVSGSAQSQDVGVCNEISGEVVRGPHGLGGDRYGGGC